MAEFHARRMVVIGSSCDERVAGFAAAVRQAGFAEPVVIGYDDLWRRPQLVAAALQRPSLLRLESPGGSFVAWQALIEAGAEVLASRGDEPLGMADADRQDFEDGLFWRLESAISHRQAHEGLVTLVRRVAAMARDHDTVLLNDVEAVGLFYDKARCHARMRDEGLSVPPAIHPEGGTLDALLAAMKAAGLPRVFVKPRYGSGAAGMVALMHSSRGLAAWSPSRIVGAGAARAIWNARRVCRFDRYEDVRLLVEAVLQAGAHIEAWVPKAGIDGAVCDLRLLMIAGEPRHLVLRQARGPMTNLHLGARRGSPERLLERLQPQLWPRLESQARRFAGCFPGALQLSFDIAIEANLARHRFLEANAFGDLLRRVDHRGLSPYEAELAALPAWLGEMRRAA